VVVLVVLGVSTPVTAPYECDRANGGGRNWGKSPNSEVLRTVPKFFPKHFLKAALEYPFYLIQVNGSSQQIAQGSDGTIQDSTGMNELEVTQIGIDVESEAMFGDPAADVNTDGSQFSPARPDTG